MAASLSSGFFLRYGMRLSQCGALRVVYTHKSFAGAFAQVRSADVRANKSFPKFCFSPHHKERETMKRN